MQNKKKEDKREHKFNKIIIWDDLKGIWFFLYMKRFKKKSLKKKQKKKKKKNRFYLKKKK
ncbi:hypothetical protein [Clostridioides difficile]|uniref:hypothetical protein n=1 Tax=Clostridioides difficile TaxID=1496 RepID=UPI0018DB0BC5|nr:hypothetical protein [Clostridioides difficile]MBH9796740.1 hypothetical protein [Clostridioides difficile]